MFIKSTVVMKTLIILTVLLLMGMALAQQNYCDSLNIQYEIIHLEFHSGYDVIKIKVPPYLSTAELMDQIRKVVIWPDSPPPRKKTMIYVYKDMDAVGAVSKTGAVYMPGKGFYWDLRDWKPDSSFLRAPTPMEIEIYNVYLDSLLKKGIRMGSDSIKQMVAESYQISPRKLDSIYCQIKWWLEIQKRKKRSVVKLSDDLYLKIK